MNATKTEEGTIIKVPDYWDDMISNRISHDEVENMNALVERSDGSRIEVPLSELIAQYTIELRSG